jgi:hypothetical protein
MKFKIIVKKWAVFYFFIQNLSEWHFSCMKEYNIVWRQELGPLTEEQENLLKQFNKIHQEYPFGKNYLGRYFYFNDRPLEILCKNILSKNFEVISETFSVFENKFNAFYEKELPLLESWRNLLEEKLNNASQNESITKTLKILYDSQNSENEVNVFLLPSTGNTTSGSGNIGDTKSITIAISRQPLENYNRTIAIFWHETIHRFFEKEHFFPLVQQIFMPDQDAVNLIKEATVSSLFPNGWLGKKFFGISNNSLNKKLPESYNKSVLELTKRYMEQNKALDKEYIDNMYSIISDLKGILK